MKHRKINTFRFCLGQEDCGRDDVEVTVEYRLDQNPGHSGNCFVDYWMNFRDYGFRSHFLGVWLDVDKDNVLEKMKLHMLRNIERDIATYEKEVACVERMLETELD